MLIHPLKTLVTPLFIEGKRMPSELQRLAQGHTVQCQFGSTVVSSLKASAKSELEHLTSFISLI